MLTEAARDQMIQQQVRAWDVLDPRVLEAMREVPRERFVPPAFRELAFADAAIPLPEGQHMLEPKLVGRMLQSLELQPGDRVLEIGTGSGFVSACLRRLAGSVRTIELRPKLAAVARAALVANGFDDVAVVEGDAFTPAVLGEERWDAILLTGSLPIHDRRFEQRLARGGRLIAVVGERPVMEARRVRRVSEAEWKSDALFETAIDPLDHAPRRETFSW